MAKALVNRALVPPKAILKHHPRFPLHGLLVGRIKLNAGSSSMNRAASGPLNIPNNGQSTTRSETRSTFVFFITYPNIHCWQGGPNQQSGYYQSGSIPGGGQYYEEKHESRGHGAAYGAVGAAAGLAGGALLMHEGEKIEGDWDYDKARMENKLEGGVQDMENFPENTARWTGEKVGLTLLVENDLQKMKLSGYS